jgi:hypothetical protein
MSDETTEGPTCSKCGENPAGTGGILCHDCFHLIGQARLPGAVVDDFERAELLADAVGTAGQ